MSDFERKTEINKRAQARYDELMRQGKHGHYETMFRVIHEERAAAIEECARWHEQRRPALSGAEYGLSSEPSRKRMRDNSVFHQECAASLRALASPAPQEETR